MRRNEDDSHLNVCCVLKERKCQESSSFCAACHLKERAKELTTGHQKWRAAVPREIWREKEALKLIPGPGELFKKQALWPTRQFTCSQQDMEKQVAVPHHCDNHKSPAWGKLPKEDRHDSSWEQHKGRHVYKAAEAGGLIWLWHVHPATSYVFISHGARSVTLDNVKRLFTHIWQTVHYLTSKDKDPSKTPKMQRTDNGRKTACWDQLLRPCVMKCDCSASEITTLHTHKVPVPNSLHPGQTLTSVESQGTRTQHLWFQWKSQARTKRWGPPRAGVQVGNGGILWPAIKMYKMSLIFQHNSLTRKSSMKIEREKMSFWKCSILTPFGGLSHILYEAAFINPLRGICNKLFLSFLVCAIPLVMKTMLLEVRLWVQLSFPAMCSHHLNDDIFARSHSVNILSKIRAASRESGSTSVTLCRHRWVSLVLSPSKLSFTVAHLLQLSIMLMHSQCSWVRSSLHPDSSQKPLQRVIAAIRQTCPGRRLTLTPGEVREQSPSCSSFLFKKPQTKPFHSYQNNYFDISETFTLGRKQSILTYSATAYFWLEVKI